jgi:hypothetical protein
MPYLYNQVQYNLGDIEMIVRVFKGVTFFFELHGPLVQDGARSKCRGAILSRSLNSRDLLQTIRANYPYTQLFFNETSLGFVGPTDLCDLCGRFRKEVSFHVQYATPPIESTCISRSTDYSIEALARSRHQ